MISLFFPQKQSLFFPPIHVMSGMNMTTQCEWNIRQLSITRAKKESISE